MIDWKNKSDCEELMYILASPVFLRAYMPLASCPVDYHSNAYLSARGAFSSVSESEKILHGRTCFLSFKKSKECFGETCPYLLTSLHILKISPMGLLVNKTTTATTYAVSSPNTHYIASLTSTHLNIHYTRSLAVAASFNLPTLRSPSPVTRSSNTTISSASEIYWSPDSLSLLLISPTGVSVFGLADTNAHTRISNGSGGLGRIAAAEVFGKNVVVVWEFGRVGVCEMGRGRVVEISELKTGIGGLRNIWSIRRIEEKVEGMFLCMKVGDG